MREPHPALLTFLRDAMSYLSDPDLMSPSREKSLAITKLQEAQFWAEQAFKKNGDPK